MRRACYSAVIVLLLSAACMHDRKPETQPPPAAATSDTTKAAPAPAAKPPASSTKAKPKGQATPAQSAHTPAAKPQPAAPAKAQPAARVRQTSAPTLDLETLKTELKQTKAIGLMTKLSLKNQVDDLLDKFRKHHSGNPTPTMAELRRSYDLLMMKVLSLLQDHDQRLASDIVSSRERIWNLLADPKKFAALQV
jgi:hypothetical protein